MNLKEIELILKEIAGDKWEEVSQRHLLIPASSEIYDVVFDMTIQLKNYKKANGETEQYLKSKKRLDTISGLYDALLREQQATVHYKNISVMAMNKLLEESEKVKSLWLVIEELTKELNIKNELINGLELDS